MKTYIVLFVIVAGFGINACKPTPTEKTELTDIKDSVKSTSECYAYHNVDTIMLHLNVVDKAVTGELVYKYNEKDMNQGLLNGVLKGDTIIADYTFNSEGKESVREVAFLRKGVDFVEGHGEMKEEGVKLSFKSLKTVTFGNDMLLRKSDCPK